MATVSRLALEVWNGLVYADLTDLVNFNTRHYNGFGLPGLNNITQRGPSQQGETYLGYRMKPRIIQLQLDTLGVDEATWHSLRASLAQVFAPSDTLLQLRYSIPPDKQRQFDCYVSIPPDWDTQRRTGYTQATVVELRAPDPTAYDPEGVQLNFQTGAGSGAWTLANNWTLASNWTLGTSTLNVTQSATMSAVNAAKSLPIVTITGPVTNPKIVNNTTGKKLDFTGNSIGSGVTYTIDTRYAVSSVTDQSGTNQLSKLTDDSDLTGFELLPGDNSITVTGTSITVATNIQMFYYNRFLTAD